MQDGGEYKVRHTSLLSCLNNEDSNVMFVRRHWWTNVEGGVYALDGSTDIGGDEEVADDDFEVGGIADRSDIFAKAFIGGLGVDEGPDGEVGVLEEERKQVSGLLPIRKGEETWTVLAMLVGLGLRRWR
jgi:hypothetical protein